MKYFYKSTIALTMLITITTSYLYAQNEHKDIVKNASSFIKQLRNNSQAGKRKASSPITLDASGLLNSYLTRFENNGNVEIYSGKLTDDENSNVCIEIKNNKVTGTINIFKKRTAYKINTSTDGEVKIEAVDFNEAVCGDFPSTSASKEKRSTSATMLNMDPLHSNINAPATIYLDFDGEYVVSPEWNGGLPINALPSGLSYNDRYVVWSIVAEDYAPFNVDVTTDRAYYDSKPYGTKHMNIITPTRTASSVGGGVAIIGSFAVDHFCPSWSFNIGAKSSGETASHEVGHTLGLEHDRSYNPEDGTLIEHFPGHNNWGAIMGGALNKPVTQWSKGEYQTATNFQDDINTISHPGNKMGYKEDDYGNTISNAYVIRTSSMLGTNAFQTYGIISKSMDVDVFRFTTNGGLLDFRANAAAPQYGYETANLDIKAELLNSSGAVIATSNPAGMNASFYQELPAGTYFIRLDGVGSGNPLIDGYSDYGSIGKYLIKGTLPSPVQNQFIVNIASPEPNALILFKDKIKIIPDLYSPANVTFVEYFDNGIKIGQSTGNTADHFLEVANFTDGQHTITIKATNANAQVVSSSSVTFTSYKGLIPDLNASNKKPNMIYDYYEGSYTALPNFSTQTPLYSGISYGSVNLGSIPARADNFAVRFSGFIKIESPSLYKFSLTSDDGSKFYINNKLLINNDGNHGMREMTGLAALVPGYYPITVEYYDATSLQGLELKIIDAYKNDEIYPTYYHNDIEPIAALEKNNRLLPGVKYEYHEGTYDSLPINFNNLSYKSMGIINTFGVVVPSRRADNFALRLSSFMNLSYSGQYKFFTTSDDGSKLYIDGKLVVLNDRTHGMIEKIGSIWLENGIHSIVVEYFDKTAGEGLIVSYSGPGIYKQEIPATVLNRDPLDREQIPFSPYTTYIPGYFEAEAYDQGGEGYGYHDNTPGNLFNEYRKDGVDINEIETYSRWVDGIQDGEWLAYTLTSTKTGPVNIVLKCTSGNGTSKVHFEKNNIAITPVTNIPVITNGNADQEVTIYNVNITQGEQVLKIYFDKGGFTLNNISVQEPSSVREDKDLSLSSEKLMAFPNPFEDYINIPSNASVRQLKIINLNGLTVWESGDINNETSFTIDKDLPSGMYILEIEKENETIHNTLIRK